MHVKVISEKRHRHQSWPRAAGLFVSVMKLKVVGTGKRFLHVCDAIQTSRPVDHFFNIKSPFLRSLNGRLMSVKR